MTNTATIKLFLPLGDPKRLRTAEISNWSGKAIAAPRTDLDQYLNRPELGSPGVYILLGTDATNDVNTAYIGEAETVCDRIKQHRAKVDWNSVIAFVSKDENLTKAHIRYLEGLIIEEAKQINRYQIANFNCSGSRLPESDLHDMHVFFDRIKQLLPVLGTDLLTPILTESSAESSVNHLYCSVKSIKATGMRSPNGFVVFAGSSAALKLRPSANDRGPWIVALRDRLIREGILTEQNGVLLFTKNVEFSSPSAAAGVVRGGTAPGPVAWVDSTGRTLKEIETSR